MQGDQKTDINGFQVKADSIAVQERDNTEKAIVHATPGATQIANNEPSNHRVCPGGILPEL